MQQREGVEVQKSNEILGEELFFEFDSIREIADSAERVQAWEAFLKKCESNKLDEVGEEIAWRAEVYLKTDRASAQISELVG